MNVKTELLKHCQKFFKDNAISCGETIYQTDCVSENALEFIEGIGDIIGYPETDSDDEE